jgi:hypothetical protein
MQKEISDNALRFIREFFPTIALRHGNDQFLSDAQAIDELLKLANSDAPANV